jgi:DNA-binding NtrC family response regulator
MKHAEPDFALALAYATPLRILVVDNSPQVGDLMRAILTRVEHSVDVVHSPSAALAHLERRSYDVVISDLFLCNDLNGMDLARAVRHMWPDVGVILSTNTSSTLSSACEPMDAVLMKPFGAADLRQLVANVAATHGG